MTEASPVGAKPPGPGDRVLLRGVIVSVHDPMEGVHHGFVMVKVDDSAPHAIPQRHDIVAVQRDSLQPGQ